jgi:dihydrofolate reductase
MRKVIVLSFISLDGVMQAPGGPEEDVDGAFSHGGWVVGYWDAVLDEVMGAQMGRPFDLLLGRRTYDIFAAAWPIIDAASPINSCVKYVATSRPLPPETDVWKNSVRLEGNVAASVAELKKGDGPELQVHGSGGLIQTLLAADLVDELWLKIFPVTLGNGKRLFADGTMAAGWELIDSKTSANGVVIASFRRAGDIKTGSFAP